MRGYKAEFILIIGIILISVLIGSQTIGLNNFFSWGIDIIIYDTYFVIDSINGFLSLTFLLLFLIFLPRVIINKFQNQFANFTVLIASGYLIYLITFLISIFVFFSTLQIPTSGVSEKGLTLYPPLNSVPTLSDGINYSTVRLVLIIFQIAFIALFGYLAYKMGLKKKKHSYKQ